MREKREGTKQAKFCKTAQRKVQIPELPHFIVYLLLMTVGIVAVYSASSEILMINGFKATVYGVRQFIYACFGVAICLTFYSLNLDLFRKGRNLMYLTIISWGLLLYVRFLDKKSTEPAAGLRQGQSTFSL